MQYELHCLGDGSGNVHPKHTIVTWLKIIITIEQTPDKTEKKHMGNDDFYQSLDESYQTLFSCRVSKSVFLCGI